MDLGELKQLLKGTSAFSLLSDDELGRFGQHFEVVHYTLGQSVVRAGDESDSFYLVTQAGPASSAPATVEKRSLSAR